MNPIRMGVIGAGHLGRIHAKLLAATQGATLVGVSDPSAANRDRVAESFGVPAYEDFGTLMPEIDAAVVASPTPTHASIVRTLLEAGKHVLCEKPLTIDPYDADMLAAIARRKRLTLQVGHVERFNPAFVALGDLAKDVKYVEATRASSFPGRCLDVGVVMDLMIHDLDLVLSMTDSAVRSVHASGVAVVSSHEDIAEARIEFESGLVANLKASRISTGACRQMQVFGPGGFAEIDFQTPSIGVIRPSETIRDREFDLSSATDNPLTYRDALFADHLVAGEQTVEPRNAILDELHDFVVSIQSGVLPTVSGEQGAAAVRLADQVIGAIGKRQWYARPRLDEIGPHAAPRPRITQPARRAA